MKTINVGYALCGSFCTMEKSVEILENLSKEVNITPIMSPIAATVSTRFGSVENFKARIISATQKEIITTVKDAEPIGPKKLLDALIIAPCTGNTLAKLALGITDTSVTMAAKAHLRNGRPLIIAVATNDALSASAKNIGTLMNTKNIYFVPMSQDDAKGKPTSVIADFDRIAETLNLALEGKQIQPILM